MAEISAATRVIALLGDPVAHSLSPRFQNAAFRAAGVDGVYVALRCDPETMPALMRGVAFAGGGGNVTVPHKERAAAVVDVPSEAVRRTGACNTFWLEDGRIHGDNTDVDGFRAAARGLVGPLAGARVLVLGAGGAARAAVFALLEERVDEIRILARSTDRARSLIRHFGEPPGVLQSDAPERLADEAFDLVVNATPLGLDADDPHPLSLDLIPRARAILDLVYAPDRTPWVREAEDRGLPAADGLEMLIHQGAAAFERWWGIPAPIDAMRHAVAEARTGH